ncbi:hypothetical protein FH972_023926 [Carpinus fangiana]|uniref:Uncharacterized protein n=1 Tax=Carpinus fangiana TaxID=176857 RepID=A0A5N6KXD2_9ROSI|nr:hypothetical protein FH972_023926 [Carpinus fangiana]
MVDLPDWSHHALTGVSLDAAGLVALTDLAVIERRTALTGSSCFADSLVICPGIHRQSDALRIHQGEYPIAANTFSGYVFRVENQGTVNYLQSVGETGKLVTLKVRRDRSSWSRLRWLIDLSGSALSTLLYMFTMVITMIVLIFMIIFNDWWGMGILLFLIAARASSIYSIRRRCSANWHGASEPGVQGALLVLLSQDRWIRLYGQVDDIKAVTSGQWLRDGDTFDDFLSSVSTVIVYGSAALASNATQIGKIMLAVMFLVNSGLLGMSNNLRHSLYMKDYIISKTGNTRSYVRRTDMAHELIKETGRDDWAVKMGLVLTSTKHDDLDDAVVHV